MHASSFREMGRVLSERLDPVAQLQILDVGSMIVGSGFRRSYRELMSPAWEYVGCDLALGENVDLVMLSPYRIQKEGAVYDAVISGQCLEHVERPWLLVPEMARMLKVGGVLIITAPWRWGVHRYPADCWRVLPDGMSVFLRDAGLSAIETYIRENDCWGIGIRTG